MRFAGITLANYMDGQDESMMAKTGLQARGMERMSNNKAQYQTEIADLQGQLAVAQAEAGAGAIQAQGSAAGQASMFSGIASGVSSLAGGAIRGANINKPPTYPGTTPDGYPLGRGSDGSYGGFGGKYGTFQPPTQLPNGNFTFG